MKVRSGLLVAGGALALALLLMVAFWPATSVQAEPDTAWDKSSLVLLSGACVDGRPTVVVENHGEAMTGDVMYRWYQTDQPIGGVLIDSGYVTFAKGEVKSFVLPLPYDVPVRFVIDQRPGHPGNSEPKFLFVESCEQPTATATATEESTPTSTPTNTPTATEENTPTNTPTATEESTPTSTPTNTPTATEESTPTSTPTVIFLPTATPMMVVTPTATAVVTSTSIPIILITPTPTLFPATGLEPEVEPTVPACPVAASGPLARPECCNSDTPQWCSYRLRLWLPVVER